MDTYYKLLGVDESMSMKDIKKEYLKLMKKKHPDRSGQDYECKEITEAYQVIIKNKLNNCSEETLHLEFNNVKKLRCDNPSDTILELENKKQEKKTIFEKVFDFFFDDSDSDD